MCEWVDLIEYALETECMFMCVCEEASVWDGGAGRPFKGCSNKAGRPPSLFFEWWLRTGWIPLLMLFGLTVIWGKCGSCSFKPPKLPVSQDWLRESLVLDIAGCWLRKPCDSEGVVTWGFSFWFNITKWSWQWYPVSVNRSFWCKYFFPFKQCFSYLAVRKAFYHSYQSLTYLNQLVIFVVFSLSLLDMLVCKVALSWLRQTYDLVRDPP